MSRLARLARCWWLLPAGLFCILRLFVAAPVFFVRSDQCGYLALGQSFPFHRLYNNQLYLIHPPLWGWIIGVFDLVMPLATAGLAATQVLALVYVALTAVYGRINRLGHAGLAVAMLFLAVHPLAIAWETQISRFPVLVVVTTLALVLFEKWLARESPSPLPPGEGSVCEANAGEGARGVELRDRSTTTSHAPSTQPSPGRDFVAGRGGEKRNYSGFPWLILLVNTLAFLTSDQCLMILPCQVVIFALSGQWRRWKPMTGLMALSAVAFLIWPAVRLGVYLTHDTYPAGLNGTIEHVGDAPRGTMLKAVFQPNLLPNTLFHNNQFTKGDFAWSNLSWENMRYLWRVIGPRMQPLAPKLAPRWTDPMFLAAAVLVVLAFVRAIRVKRNLVTIDWADLAISVKLLAITALLYLPAAAGLYPWFGMAALGPFALLLGRGVDGMRQLRPRMDLPAAWLISMACLPIAGWWLWSIKAYPVLPHWPDPRQGGNHFLYACPVQYRAAKLAAWFNQRPDGGAVMAEYSMELTLLTDRRCFDVPFEPSELWKFIENYDVRYVVIDDNAYKWAKQAGPNRRKAARGDTFNLIVSDTGRFRRVDHVTDDYGGSQAPDSFSIFEVVRP